MEEKYYLITYKYYDLGRIHNDFIKGSIVKYLFENNMRLIEGSHPMIILFAIEITKEEYIFAIKKGLV